ncbi:MAG: hypothetical protein IPN83_15910 [Holophagales bacterium]|jgi:hypothetical protein|nr:hypothetical protein [Holophagales bacterium]
MSKRKLPNPSSTTAYKQAHTMATSAMAAVPEEKWDGVARRLLMDVVTKATSPANDEVVALGIVGAIVTRTTALLEPQGYDERRQTVRGYIDYFLDLYDQIPGHGDRVYKGVPGLPEVPFLEVKRALLRQVFTWAIHAFGESFDDADEAVQVRLVQRLYDPQRRPWPDRDDSECSVATVADAERLMILDVLREDYPFELGVAEALLQLPDLPDELRVFIGKRRIHLGGAKMVKQDVRNAEMLEPLSFEELSPLLLSALRHYVFASNVGKGLRELLNEQIDVARDPGPGAATLATPAWFISITVAETLVPAVTIDVVLSGEGSASERDHLASAIARALDEYSARTAWYRRDGFLKPLRLRLLDATRPSVELGEWAIRTEAPPAKVKDDSPADMWT